MDEQTKTRIFEPFFTTKEIGKGTGLGLSMVYRIVEQSGGSITCESELGHGTVFAIVLPCVNEHDAACNVEDELPPGVGSGDVLLVEDDPSVRQLATRTLAQAGYTVLAKCDGREAASITDGDLAHVDLLVTDMIMPGVSGAELAGQLRARRPDLRVLYVSGYSDHPLMESTGPPARAEVLRKPFTGERLLAAVNKAIAVSAIVNVSGHERPSSK